MARRFIFLPVILVCCEGVAGSAPDTSSCLDPFADRVVSFTPGDNAGFGQDRMPEAVLGPPRGGGEMAGSLDVVSLGAGGEMVLAFDPPCAADGPGADLVVFENAFYAGGNSAAPFAEYGEVSVSADGEAWSTFGCDPGDPAGSRCAGAAPVLLDSAVCAGDAAPEDTGGDAFDLSEVGLSGACFVRVRDVGGQGSKPMAGFDLDAIMAINIDNK